MIRIGIGNLQFDEDSDETARAKITINGLAGIGLDAIGPDAYIGLMPDARPRKACSAPIGRRGGAHQQRSAPAGRGPREGPFYGAEFEKKGVVKGAVLLSRAAAQHRVKYTAGLLKDLVAGIAKGMLAAN